MSAADRLIPARLIDQACELAGSDDFGSEFDENETWREGLGLFCDGLIRDARLNELGVELAALDIVEPLRTGFRSSNGESPTPKSRRRRSAVRSSSSASPAPEPRSFSISSPRIRSCVPR